MAIDRKSVKSESVVLCRAPTQVDQVRAGLLNTTHTTDIFVHLLHGLVPLVISDPGADIKLSSKPAHGVPQYHPVCHGDHVLLFRGGTILLPPEPAFPRPCGRRPARTTTISSSSVREAPPTRRGTPPSYPTRPFPPRPSSSPSPPRPARSALAVVPWPLARRPRPCAASPRPVPPTPSAWPGGRHT